MTTSCKRTIFWATLTGLVLGLSACAPVITYPPRGDNALETGDANKNPAPKVMAIALRRVTSRFGVEGDYVINLPQGMERRTAEALVRRLDDAHAHVMLPEHEAMPVFHVVRVWVRAGSWAEVEILRPMVGLAVRGEPMVYEPVTIRMSKSAMQPWKIDSLRAWSGRAAEAPPIYGWPEPEAALAAEPIDTMPEK